MRQARVQGRGRRICTGAGLRLPHGAMLGLNTHNFCYHTLCQSAGASRAGASAVSAARQLSPRRAWWGSGQACVQHWCVGRTEKSSGSQVCISSDPSLDTYIPSQIPPCACMSHSGAGALAGNPNRHVSCHNHGRWSIVGEWSYHKHPNTA